MEESSAVVVAFMCTYAQAIICLRKFWGNPLTILPFLYIVASFHSTQAKFGTFNFMQMLLPHQHVTASHSSSSSTKKSSSSISARASAMIAFNLGILMPCPSWPKENGEDSNDDDDDMLSRDDSST
jgi:hypothetical protein